MVYHWQAIHRGAFYRGGPIKTAISSGIDQALWDIKGKVYGVPVYKLLGGPTRDRIRVYGTVNKKTGVNAMKTGPPGMNRGPFKYVEGQKFVDEVVDNFKALRQKYGYGVDIGIDFHGAVEPPTAMLLIKALEPYQPWFYEEVVQCLNVDVMAEIAKKTAHPAGYRRTHLHQVGLPRNSRKARRHHPAARHLLRRRHHRTADHRRHGGGLLFPHGPAQPAGPLFARGQPADRRLDPELPHPGTRRQRVRESAGQASAARQNGHRPLLTDPGLGITIDEEQTDVAGGRAHAVPPRFDPDDGSVVDW